jgi:hypothetical protein
MLIEYGVFKIVFLISFFQCDSFRSHCETVIRHETSGFNRILAIRELRDLIIMFIGP